MTVPSFLFLARRPSPALAPFVERLWYFEGALPHGLEPQWPTGAMQLLVNLHSDELRWFDEPTKDAHRAAGAGWSGVALLPRWLDVADQRRIVGVTFLPGGAAAFLPCPASELRDGHATLSDVWGSRAASSRDQIVSAATTPAACISAVEALLARELRADAQEGSTQLRWAVDALSAGRRVAQVVDRLGTTPRHFIERFSHRVGVKPKTFARLVRFRRALELSRTNPDWAGVAVAAGYYDQAHLIRDFKEFARMTPTTLVHAPAVDATLLPPPP